MRPFLLLTLAFSVASSAFAQTPKEKWEGYRAVEDLRELNLPFQEFAENAVFLLETVGSTKTPGEKIEIVETEKYPKITDKKTLVNDIVALQIETCRKQNLAYCPLFKYSTLGTMFFNNGVYRTCRHGFHNWISLAAEANARSSTDIIPPIILRIANNEKPGKFKILYNSSYENSKLFRFSFINPDPRLNFQFHFSGYPTQNHVAFFSKSDFAELTLEDMRISEDYSLETLEENSSSLTKDTEVFAIGFPAKTNLFANSRGDTPGLQLMASNGFVIKTVLEKGIFESSNFGSKGISGGPVVTANGKIVGMLCMGTVTADPSLVISDSFLFDKKLLKQIWTSSPRDQASFSN